MTLDQIQLTTELVLWLVGIVSGISFLGAVGCLVCDKLDEHYPLN